MIRVTKKRLKAFPTNIVQRPINLVVVGKMVGRHTKEIVSLIHKRTNMFYLLILWSLIGYWRLYLTFKEMKRYHRSFEVDASCFIWVAIWPFFDRRIR